MQTEYEVTYENVSHDQVREKIKELWAVCIQEKTLMKRVVFKHKDNPLKKSYFRLRDEWNKVTCTYKTISDGKIDIHSIKEIECEVSDFKAMEWILEMSWLQKIAYQESYRETWKISDEVFFMLDEWPGIKPFIEIEWVDESIVKEYSEKLGFDYSTGVFWAVDELYYRELSIPHDIINTTKRITFDTPIKK